MDSHVDKQLRPQLAEVSLPALDSSVDSLICSAHIVSELPNPPKMSSHDDKHVQISATPSLTVVSLPAPTLVDADSLGTGPDTFPPGANQVHVSGPVVRISPHPPPDPKVKPWEDLSGLPEPTPEQLRGVKFSFLQYMKDVGINLEVTDADLDEQESSFTHPPWAAPPSLTPAGPAQGADDVTAEVTSPAADSPDGAAPATSSTAFLPSDTKDNSQPDLVQTTSLATFIPSAADLAEEPTDEDLVAMVDASGIDHASYPDTSHLRFQFPLWGAESTSVSWLREIQSLCSAEHPDEVVRILALGFEEASRRYGDPLSDDEILGFRSLRKATWEARLHELSDPGVPLPYEVWKRTIATLVNGHRVQPARRSSRGESAAGWGKSSAKGLRGRLDRRMRVKDPAPIDETPFFVGRRHGKRTDGPERPTTKAKDRPNKPRPDAALPLVRAWLKEDADALESHARFWSERPALTKSAEALAAPTYAGSRRATSLLIPFARVYLHDASAEHLLKYQPGLLKGVLEICGQRFDSETAFSLHCAEHGCFRKHRPAMDHIRRFLLGDLSPTEALSLVRTMRKNHMESPEFHAKAKRAADPEQFQRVYQGASSSAPCEDCDWDCWCGARARPHHRPSPPPKRRGLWSRLYQGAVQSVPTAPRPTVSHPMGPHSTASVGGLNITVEHHFPELEGLLQTLRALGGTDESRARSLMKVGTLLAQCLRSPTWIDMALAVVQYALSIDWLWSLCKRSFLKLQDYANLARRRYQAGGQGEDEDSLTPLGWATDAFRALWNSVVLVAIRETLGTTYASLSLAVTDFAKTLRVTTLKSFAEDAAKWFKNALAEFACRVQRCYDLRSWEPLWGPGRDPARWSKHTQGLLAHQGLVTSVSGRQTGPRKAELAELIKEDVLPACALEGLTQHSYLRLLEHQRTVGEELAAHLDGAKLSAARTLISALNQRITIVAAGLHGADRRVRPLGVYLHGGSQVGKSVLANLVMKAVGAAHDYPTDPASLYTWKVGVNFQDGLNSSVWGVLMDDVDQITGASNPGMRVFTQDWIDLINVVPFPVEAARAEEKGTLHAEPLLVIMTSNFDTAQVKKYAKFPEAFWNRADVHARISVKPEFREKRRDEKGEVMLHPDGTPITLDRLDKDLALNTHDVYQIYLGTYRGKQADDSNSYFAEAPEPISVSEFVKLVNRRYDTHMSAQRRVLSQAVSTDYHKCCFLPVSRPCSCVSAQQQAGQIVLIPRGITRSLTQEEIEKLMASLDHEEDDLQSDLQFCPLCGSEDLCECPGYVFEHCCEDCECPIRDCRCEAWVTGLGSRIKRLQKYITSKYFRARSFVDDTLVPFLAPKIGFLWYCASSILGIAAMGLAPGLVARVASLWGFLSAVCWGSWTVFGLSVSILDEAFREFPVASLGSLMLVIAGCAALGSVAQRIYQARGDGVAGGSWIPVPEVFGPTAPPNLPRATWTRDQIERAVSRSLFKISTSVGHCWALALTPTVLAVPTHMFAKGFADMTLDLGLGPQTWSVDPSWVIPSALNKEVVFVHTRTSSSSGVVQYLPPVLDTSVVRYDELVLLGGPDRGRASHGLNGELKNGELVTQCQLDTQEGDCGRPYIGRVGSSWWLVSLHYMHVRSTFGYGWATGARLTGRDAGSAIRQLAPGAELPAEARVMQCVHSTPAGEPWSIVPLPPSAISEARTAGALGRARGLYLVGTISPPPHASTPVSRLKRTPYADCFSAFEVRYCGSSPYWGSPVFKGEMREIHGKRVWCSPLQTAFSASTCKQPPKALVMVALMDYLNGAQNLNFEDVREFSKAEALVGVSQVWMNPVNPKTSIGLPWGGPKFKMMERDGRHVSLDPRFDRALDEVYSELTSGYIPICAGRVTLKDEARKPQGEARVFTVVPAVLNITIKRVMGSLLAVLRANPEFFECWLGIDMTSSKVEHLVRFLRAVDPDLVRVMDMDKSKMDKSWIPVLWQAVRMVFSALSAFAGVDRGIAERLLFSLEFLRYEWKGDLFESPQQPSGQQFVIEANSIYESLTARIIYYAARPELVAAIPWEPWLARFHEDPTVPDGLPLTFRLDHATAHFGDDNVTATRRGVPPLLDPDAYSRLVGQVATNGLKTAGLTEGPLSGVTFLKRRLVFDAELGYHLAPLEPASLLKACVCAMPSTLSEVDRAAVSLTQQVREAALHGPAFHRDFSACCQRAAEQHGFADHPFFKNPPYAEHRAKMMAGAFTVYEDIPGFIPGVDHGGEISLDPFQDNCNVVFN